MKMFKLSALLLGMLLFTAALPAQAQQQRQHQQMQHHMQGMMQNIDKLMHRTHTLSQNMTHRLQQAQSEQMRNHCLLMQRMGDNLGTMAGQLKNTMERYDLMMKDPYMMGDPDMMRDMKKLRTNLNDMSGQIEKSVEATESLPKRLQQHKPDN